VEVPKGAQCFMGVYFSKDGGVNTDFTHIIDGTVGGFFYFGNSIPVQTNISYQILAFPGVDHDFFCKDKCLFGAANLSPTDNDLKNDFWIINKINFIPCS
ncbi:21590_t:CDS:1, partial [Gigaspora rosea]